MLVHQDLEVRLIHSRGYSRHIGPGRLADHAQLAIRLRGLLRESRPPDVAFVGYPPIEPAAVLTRWLRQRDVPTLLDVKDQWPNVLLRAFPRHVEPGARIALSGYTYLGRRAMRDATGISSISEPFLDWALTFSGRKRSEWDLVSPLTVRAPPAELRPAADSYWDGLGVTTGRHFRVVFVGSFSTSFDFEPIAKAARDNPDMQFVLCGTGSRESAVRRLMAGLPNVIMPGWVDGAQSAALHARSDAALAPYSATDDFRLSIPNKVLDALLHGVPVFTSLRGAVQSAVVNRGAGYCYSAKDGSLSEGLRLLRTDSVWRNSMRKSALLLYDNTYSYQLVYEGLATHLEHMSASGRTP